MVSKGERLSFPLAQCLLLAFENSAISSCTPDIIGAINEAVELAKVYGSDSAPRFINSVLGTLADHCDDLRRELLEAEGVLA